MEDNVNKPAHYTKGNFEAIDVIQDVVQFYDPTEAWLIGQVLKYIMRAPHKGAKLEDIKKAQWYLNRVVTACQMHTEQPHTNTSNISSAVVSGNALLRHILASHELPSEP